MCTGAALNLVVTGDRHLLCCSTGESSLKKDKTVGPWQQRPAASQATAGIHINSIHITTLFSAQNHIQIISIS